MEIYIEDDLEKLYFWRAWNALWNTISRIINTRNTNDSSEYKARPQPLKINK